MWGVERSVREDDAVIVKVQSVKVVSTLRGCLVVKVWLTIFVFSLPSLTLTQSKNVLLMKDDVCVCCDE